jgi:hypothetical protein
VACLDVLTVPSKKLVWFEQSGHEPFVDEPARFKAAMGAGSASSARAAGTSRMTGDVEQVLYEPAALGDQWA